MYTKEYANKAAMRHTRRSVDERLMLLRAILSTAAYDMEPIFKGESCGKPFEGPPVNQWLAKTVGYFLANHLPKAMVMRLISEGYELYLEHNTAFIAARKTTEPG